MKNFNRKLLLQKISSFSEDGAFPGVPGSPDDPRASSVFDSPGTDRNGKQRAI